jgi:hypothetical protein
MNLSRILLGLAGRLMPPDRAEWFDAMRAELHALDRAERLRWAFGCFLAALKQRFAPMDTGNFRVSRWVILVETLGAFGPLTLAFWEITFGGSGLVRLSPAIVEKVFMHYPGGPYIFAMQIVGAIVGLIGPVGLFLGLRYVLKGVGLRNRALGWTLFAIPVVAHLSGTIAGFIAGPPDFGISASGFWLYTVMLTAAPAAVIWHLMALARPGSSHLSPPGMVAAITPHGLKS